MPEPRLPSNTVDPRAKWYWLLSSAITLVIVVAVVAVPALIWEPVRPWFFGASAVILVVGGLRVAIMPALRFRVHRWEVSDTAVYAKSGWLSREWKIAPLSRIQTVEAKRNPLHQLLGLASVSVTTGSSYGAIIIQGLAADVAEKVVADLTESTQHTVGDAT